MRRRNSRVIALLAALSLTFSNVAFGADILSISEEPVGALSLAASEQESPASGENTASVNNGNDIAGVSVSTDEIGSGPSDMVPAQQESILEEAETVSESISDVESQMEDETGTEDSSDTGSEVMSETQSESEASTETELDTEAVSNTEGVSNTDSGMSSDPDLDFDMVVVGDEPSGELTEDAIPAEEVESEASTEKTLISEETEDEQEIMLAAAAADVYTVPASRGDITDIDANFTCYKSHI